MTIDLRTRPDVDVETIDAADFFTSELPDLAAARSALAVPGARELGVRPLTVETAAGTWTLSVDGDKVRVSAGDGGQAKVRLDEDEITDIVHDRRTPMTLLAAGTLDMPEGELGDFLDWWVVLRSLPAPCTPQAPSPSPTATGATWISSAPFPSTTIPPSWRTTSPKPVTCT
jgi:hypothetical protein